MDNEESDESISEETLTACLECGKPLKHPQYLTDPPEDLGDIQPGPYGPVCIEKIRERVALKTTVPMEALTS